MLFSIRVDIRVNCTCNAIIFEASLFIVNLSKSLTDKSLYEISAKPVYYSERSIFPNLPSSVPLTFGHFYRTLLPVSGTGYRKTVRFRRKDSSHPRTECSVRSFRHSHVGPDIHHLHLSCPVVPSLSVSHCGPPAHSTHRLSSDRT